MGPPESVLSKLDPGARWVPLKFRVRVNWCMGVRVELSQAWVKAWAHISPGCRWAGSQVQGQRPS